MSAFGIGAAGGQSRTPEPVAREQARVEVQSYGAPPSAGTAAPAAEPTPLGDFRDAVLRCIPGDVVGGYLAVTALLSVTDAGPLVGITVLFLVATVAVTHLGARSAAVSTSKGERIAIAVCAYVVWVSSLPGSAAEVVLGVPDWARGTLLVVGAMVIGRWAQSVLARP